ncbi:MAG: ribonuclease P protein component [Actinomycetota bacterium]|nr:ribonuclease P protein component [Actinomycetota bacterium]
MVAHGQRAGRRTLAGYLLLDQSADAGRVGFIVSRGVGGAVVRNRVRRRLRELMRRRTLPAGSLLVLRVLPPAAGLCSAQLDRELDALMRRLSPVGP